MKAELLAQIKKGDKESAELFRGLEVETSGRFEALEKTSAAKISALNASLAQATATLAQTIDRIKDLEEETAKQMEASEKASEERISSLEGISQMRDSLFQATLTVETLEQDTFNRISSLETTSADKIKSLEEVNDKQNMDYNNMYQLITTMMEAHLDLERRLPKIIKVVLKEHPEEQRAKILPRARGPRIKIGRRL